MLLLVENFDTNKKAMLNIDIGKDYKRPRIY